MRAHLLQTIKLRRLHTLGLFQKEMHPFTAPDMASRISSYSGMTVGLVAGQVLTHQEGGGIMRQLGGCLSEQSSPLQ
jgi:hypothetical protein